MTTVHVFAHFDDEYCGLPLIAERAAAGEDQLFLYVADYARPALAERRFAETQNLLEHLGVDRSKVLHVGRGTGAVDGAVFRALPAAYAALQAALAGVGPIDRFVTLAWEGGHMDHDMCALMTTELAKARGNPPIETISLYTGPGLGGPFFHGAWPLAENGPVRKMALSAADWLRWMAAVRFFPSQIKTWLGLWPAMFWSYAWRGFGVQRLDSARVLERPHQGALFYERMFKVPYAEVRGAADAFLSRPR